MKTPATMYCEHCGALVEADSKFCVECGNKLHETSTNQRQIQPEPPRKHGTSSPSIALAAVGICILVVLVGSLLFSVQTPGKPLPSDLPPLKKFTLVRTTPLFDCVPGKVYYYRMYHYETADHKAIVQLFVDLDRQSAHPAVIGKLTRSSAQEWWVDVDMKGVNYQYFDSEAAFNKQFGVNICAWFRHK
jgi:hypothetical protein